MRHPVAAVGTSLTREQLEEIIEEIALYDVELESDPTQPHLGTKYLQETISKCRRLQNRVQYYFQIVKLHEKKIKLDLRQREIDLELKTNQKLADDPLVRQQPSVKDREALAAVMLQEEHMVVADLKVQLLDVEETVKLVKFKYDQLRQTSNDVKMQRILIKDDKEAQFLGGEGYSPPQAGQRGIVEGGMSPAVRPRAPSPTDLIAGMAPEAMPPPLDSVHSEMIEAFISSQPVKVPPWTCGSCGKTVEMEHGKHLVCPDGHRALCIKCGEPQFYTLSGGVCKFGHGGAESTMVGPEGLPPEPDGLVTGSSYKDFLDP